MKEDRSKLRIKQVKSIIGKPKNQRRTIRALGLKRINDWVEQKDCPEIRGMVNKVKHLVEVERVEEVKKVEEEKTEGEIRN